LTESKEIIVPDRKEFFYIFHKEEIKEQPKEARYHIPFEGFEIERTKISSSNPEVDMIEKRRELKRWKQSLNYYCLHPEKFKFSFKDLK
jgi:hypothetical protein